MAKKKSALPEYERPEMPFERDADLDLGASRWMAVGFEFAAYVALFFLGGLYLDGKFDTRPWLAAAGALVGVAVAMTMLIRRVTSATAEKKHEPPKR